MIDKKQITALLRDARARNKMSVEEVATALKAYGFDLAPKSLYNYESGNSMPQVPIFIAMCKVYGIEDIIDALHNTHTIRVEVSQREQTLLNYFKAASPELQDAALRMLEPVEKDNTASRVG